MIRRKLERVKQESPIGPNVRVFSTVMLQNPRSKRVYERYFYSVGRVALTIAVLTACLTIVAFPHTTTGVWGQEPAAAIPGADGLVRLSEGRIVMKVPKSWQARRPQTRIVEYEFAAPPVEGDSAEARITIMGAGGGVEANIARWIDQFEQPDGSSSKDKTRVEKTVIAGAEVHIVSITGTYKDRAGGGPFAPGPVTRRPGYRMLGAILVTPNLGHYYVKLYGPEKTVNAQEGAFRELLQSLSIAAP